MPGKRLDESKRVCVRKLHEYFQKEFGNGGPLLPLSAIQEMDGEIVTKEQCIRILSRYVEEAEESKEATLTSFSTCPLSKQLDGLIGEQFFLTLTYQQGEKQKKAKFFVKIISNDNPVMYQIAKEIAAFEKESFFYEKFIPYLREEGFNCDFVPKSYFCESDTIILEDLGLSSYKCTEKKLPLDVEHCKFCLKTIAKFHTNSILFELKKSKDLAWEYKLAEAFPEIFEDNILIDSNANSLVRNYYSQSVKGLCKLVLLLPENTVKTAEFIGALIAALEKIPPTTEAAIKKFKVTLSHNDLWCNNILYKYGEDNEILDCKLIDFQTINLKPPIMDVLGFLYTNTRKIFRDKHFKDMLTYYYSCFAEYIEESGYNVAEILSEEEFWSSYDYLKLTSKLHCVIDRSFTLIPEEVYIQHSKSKEDFSNFMFEGRGAVMSELFKTDGIYKEVMIEELCEIRSMLFKS